MKKNLSPFIITFTFLLVVASECLSAEPSSPAIGPTLNAISSIYHNWGPAIDGFSISAALPKPTYKLNSEITVYQSCVQQGRDWTLTFPMAPPCSNDVDLEIRNAAGTLVKGTGLAVSCPFQDERAFVADGRVETQSMKKGEIINYYQIIEKECTPTKPGIYTITAVWHVRENKNNLESVTVGDVRSWPIIFQVVN